MRRVVAVVVGALTCFAWGAVSHMVLGLGDAGLKSIPPAAEAGLADIQSTSIPDSGLYYYPGMAAGTENDPAAQAEWQKKADAGASGILLVNVGPGHGMNARTFTVELLTDLAVATLALFLLCCAAGCCRTLISRVLFVAMLGAMSALLRDIPFWNWYGFPIKFTLAQFADSFIGMALLGLVLALIAGKSLDACHSSDSAIS